VGKEYRRMSRNSETLKSNKDLLKEFEDVVVEYVKASNKMSRKSEAKLSRDAERLRSEILRRLEAKE
jgi:predicted transposase YbfD/YdcC